MKSRSRHAAKRRRSFTLIEIMIVVVIIGMLAALVEEKYVDDVRYAGAFAREKAGLQGWGPIKIRFQLRSKGISEDAIAAALEEVEPGRAADKLERLLAAKARTLEGDPQFRLKMLKFGLSRGYEYAAVEEALKKIGL